MTNTERKARWRAKRRAMLKDSADPVRSYCRRVMAWNRERRTSGSSLLAAQAAEILQRLDTHPVQQSVATLMGFGDSEGTEAVTDAGQIAQDGLTIALGAMNDGNPSDAAVRAGLRHARFLALREPRYESDEAQRRLTLAQLGVDWRTMDTSGMLAPDRLVGEPVANLSDVEEPMEVV